jgi:hypothetical protein
MSKRNAHDAGGSSAVALDDTIRSCEGLGSCWRNNAYEGAILAFSVIRSGVSSAGRTAGPAPARGSFVPGGGWALHQ